MNQPHAPVRGRGIAMGSQLPAVPDRPYRWQGVPGWDPARLGPMLIKDSPARPTPSGRGPSTAVEEPPAVAPDAAHPRGGRRGTSPRDVARGEPAGPVEAAGPAVSSPEPPPTALAGTTEGEPAPWMGPVGAGSPTDTDPVGSTRSSAVLPAAGREPRRNRRGSREGRPRLAEARPFDDAPPPLRLRLQPEPPEAA